MAQVPFRESIIHPFEYDYEGEEFGKGVVHGNFRGGSLSFGGPAGINIEKGRSSCNRFQSLDLAYAWYDHQMHFSGTKVVNIMLHDDRRVIYEGVYRWREWLENLFVHWDQNNQPDWYEDYFRERFLRVFGDVFTALREMHASDQYHGNMQDGIAILWDGSGSKLFNMQPVPGASLDDIQKHDALNLLLLIDMGVHYPSFRADGVPLPNLPRLPLMTLFPEVNQSCMAMLNGWTAGPNYRRWGLRPPLFWETKEKIRFLKAVHWVYGHSPCRRHLTKKYSSCFGSGWIHRPFNDAELARVFTYQRRYQDKDKLVYYRNCQEHYQYDLMLHSDFAALPEHVNLPAHVINSLYKEYLLGSSPRNEYVHDRILDHVPACWTESLEMMAALTKPMSNFNDQLAASFIYLQMGW